MLASDLRLMDWMKATSPKATSFPAKQMIGRRLSQEEAALRLRARHRGRRCVVDGPSTFLFNDPSGALKGGVKVCQRRLVNELLGPLVTEFVRNFGREDATPYQRGSNGGLLSRVQAVKLMRHSALRHLNDQLTNNSVQAICRRRRANARRTPPAKIRPGRPAPAMGPGTPVVEIVSTSDANV